MLNFLKYPSQIWSNLKLDEGNNELTVTIPDFPVK
jgi:hypothetical protein